MKSPVGDLVDAALSRLSRVALADGEQDKRGLPCLAVDVEDRAPPTVGLRYVVLHATPEPRPVASFRIARAQRVYGDTALPQLLNRKIDCGPRSIARVPQVLGEDLLVNPQRKARAPRRCVDSLSLAVGGLHQRPVLAPELLGLLRAHRLGARPLADLLDGGRFRGPIGSKDQLYLRRLLIGHRLNLLVQLGLGHAPNRNDRQGSIPDMARAGLAGAKKPARSTAPATAGRTQSWASDTFPCPPAPCRPPCWRL